jgi:O-antigen ligase
MIFPLGLTFGLMLWRPSVALPVALFFLPLINIHFGLGLVEKTLSFEKVLLPLLVLAWGAGHLVRRDYRIPKDPLLSLWVAWLLVQTITLLLVGESPVDQTWYLAEQVAYLLFFVMALDVLKIPGTSLWVLRVLMVCGWVVAVLGLSQELFLRLGGPVPVLTYPSTGRWSSEFGSTIGHPNFFSAFQILTLPLTAWAWWRGSGRQRVALSFLGLIQVAGVFLAKSIGGVVGLAVGGLVVAWWKGGRLWRLVGPLLAAVAVAAILWLVQARDPKGLDRSIAIRAHILGVARHMFLDSPFFGQGLGRFTTLFPEYEPVFAREDLEGDIKNWRAFPKSTSSHNWYLRLVIEGGLASLVVFLGLIGWVLATRWHALRAPPLVPSSIDAPWALRLALLVSLVGFAVQAMTDELFAYSKIVMVFWTLVAVGVNLDGGPRMEGAG